LQNNDLAFLGGSPVVRRPYKSYKWNRLRDGLRVLKVIREGQMSGFLAQPNDSHFGGKWVREVETLWEQHTSTSFAVTFNSWTSGLEVAIASADLEVGSEVIVPSWTMSATISAIVKNSLKPSFIDIDSKTFNLDVSRLEEVFSNRTQAVLAVDIFGYPCDAVEIKRFCKKKGLVFLIDGAQTPHAKNKLGKRNAEMSDICGYSFNRHKHIQTGEGGIAVTSNKEFADKMRLYRNHFEVTKGIHNSKYIELNKVGNNYRLGEIEALLAAKQTLRIEKIVGDRRKFARELIFELSKYEYLQITKTESWDSHDYYILGMIYDYKQTNVSRDVYVAALKAEGLKNVVSNYSDLHNLATFREYPRGDMSSTEELNNLSFIGLYICGTRLNEREFTETKKVFKKINDSINALKR
jgi:dTDP-4-amino-4,6-dideoxygalactose transaminase